MGIIEKVLGAGRDVLSEYEAKQLLSEYGFCTSREVLAGSAEEVVEAAQEIGFPVVIKGYGPGLMHKTESGAVFLHVNDAAGARVAYEKMEKSLGTGLEGALVSEMVQGKREIVMGLHREPGFGPCVMIGLGGVMTELLNDTAFRIAPFDEAEAADMASELRAKGIFEPFRGEVAADMESVCRCLTGIGKIGLDHPEISEIDVNPLIIRPDGRLVAVDALVVLKGAV